MNLATNWSTPATDLGYADYPHLAGGPLGLFMIGGNGARGLFVRKFDGTTFGAPDDLCQRGRGGPDRAVPGPGRPPARGLSGPRRDGLSRDPRGVRRRRELAGERGRCAMPSNEQDGMRVAAAADHIGVAVWATSGTNDIRVSVVGPDTPVTAPPPPVATPTPTPVGAARAGLPQERRRAAGEREDPGAVEGQHAIRRSERARRCAAGRDDRRQGRRRRAVLGAVRPRRGADGEALAGMFKVSQPGGVTDFALNEPLAACPLGHAATAAAAKKPKTRKLFGDGKGAFQTTGRYSAATVRGTRWLVQDSCAGTLTKVTQGTVNVRDNVRHRTVVVRAHKQYTARPRR